MIIGVTGHRPPKLDYDYDYVKPISTSINNRFIHVINKYNPTSNVSGMALGVDTLWAILTLKLRIPLIAAVPFVGQEKMWPKKSQDLYHSILNNPLTTVHIVSTGGYSPEKMQIRNKWIVDNINLLIAVWDGTPGGTANCVGYATERVQILRIDPRTLKH